MEREPTNHARQQEVVAALAQKALSGTVTSLYQHAAAMIRETLDVCCVAVLEVLPGGRELLLQAGEGWPTDVVGHARMDASIRFFPGYVLSCKSTVIVRNFAEDKRFDTPQLLTEHGAVSGIALSIHDADRCFGVVSAFARTPREFSANDTHFLQLVAYVLAAAIQRQNAEAGLRERELLLRRVIDSNPNIIFVKDRTGTILLANQALADSYGVTIQEIVGQSHAGLHVRWGMKADEVRKWLADDRQVIETGQPLNLIEQFTHRDGSVHWYNTRKLPLTLGANRACVLIVSADISEQKEAENRIRQLNIDLERRVEQRTAALAQANKELEAFSYSISHDLRSPLRAIDGFAQIIREDYADKLDKDGLRHLNVICDSAKKMGELIDDLLQFSKLGRAELQTSRVDMSALAHTVVDDLKQLEPHRKMHVTIGDLPPALGDPAMLRQVLINLVSNSLKFTREASPRVDIGGFVENAETIYFVCDNGVGFDTKYAHKLFQVFQRLHRSEDFDGTGVGLAIVQRIVQRHGGRLWAEAKVNHGATFYFALPNK